MSNRELIKAELMKKCSCIYHLRKALEKAVEVMELHGIPTEEEQAILDKYANQNVVVNPAKED